MSGSARKRRSEWDVKDIQPASALEEKVWTTRRERYSGVCDVNPSNSEDCSGWSSKRSLQIDNGMNDGDTNNRGRHTWVGDNYPKSISPAIDESDWKTRSRSPYRSRGMSRSRVRSRSGGRAQNQSKSRSRSRSRSRSTSKPRHWGRSRSRSPVFDRRRESYGLVDKRRSNGSGPSSQPCRDFAVGRCRKGSQCRFIHQSNPNYRDRGHPDSNSVEGCRERSDHGSGSGLKENNSRALNDSLWNDTSDGYRDSYDRGEPLKNSSKARFCCKDFIKGNCRWGASCRFSHDDVSTDDYSRGNRNTSIDQDGRQYSNKNGKFCKFFLMGKCSRDDCRFSHGDPNTRNPEVRASDEFWGHTMNNNNIPWNGPTWDETASVSVTGIQKATTWDENLIADKTLPDFLASETKTDGEWSHALQKESRTWIGSKWDNQAAEGDESREKGSDRGRTEFFEKMVNIEGVQLNQFPQPQTQDTHVNETNSSHLSASVMHPRVPQTSFCQQLPDGDISRVNGLNPLPELDRSSNTMHPVLVPVKSFNEKLSRLSSQSLLVSSGSSQSQDLLYSSNGQGISLNGHMQHILSPLSLQNRVEINHEEAVERRIILEEVPPLSSEMSHNDVTDEKFTQTGGFVASERFVNGPQLHTLDAGLGALDRTILECNPGMGSLAQYDHIIDITKSSNSGNSGQASGLLQSSFEQNHHMPSEKLCLPSLPNYASSEIQNNCLKVESDISPQLKQQGPVTGVEASKHNHVLADKSKQKEEETHSENVEAEHRVEEEMNSKDEKAMRLFKNQLVEFVKEILKPTWKEGKMSREVHKTIVKKVVDKVTNTIQGDHIPKTQDKIDQYLSFAKPKITKLVQAYTERLLKS